MHHLLALEIHNYNTQIVCLPKFKSKEQYKATIHNTFSRIFPLKLLRKYLKYLK